MAQCLYKVGRIKKEPSSRTYKLRSSPQVGTVVWRVFYASPKKPNSGKRRVIKARIKHVKRHDRLTARVIGYNTFPKKYFKVLVRGGRGNDTPGVTYTGLRGVYDFRAHAEKTKRRSFYGIKRPIENIKRVKKALRKRGINSVAEVLASIARGITN